MSSLMLKGVLLFKWWLLYDAFLNWNWYAPSTSSYCTSHPRLYLLISSRCLLFSATTYQFLTWMSFVWHLLWNFLCIVTESFRFVSRFWSYDDDIILIFFIYHEIIQSIVLSGMAISIFRHMRFMLVWFSI